VHTTGGGGGGSTAGLVRHLLVTAR